MLIVFLLTISCFSFVQQRHFFLDKFEFDKRSQVINFLEKNNLYFGYSSYFEANVFSALSNGKIEIANLIATDSNTQKMDFSPYLWVTTERYQHPPYANKVPFFLLLKKEEVPIFDKVALTKGKKVYSDDWYEVYMFTDPAIHQ